MTPFISKQQIAQLPDFMGERYGVTWTADEHRTLLDHFRCGKSIYRMMEEMRRPAAGILAKLVDHGCIQKDADGNYFYVNQTTTVQPTKEHEMTQNAANIETKTVIRGQDAATLSDDQIFSLIGKLEQEAEGLGKIQNKPKKLGAKIEAIHDDIKKLVEYVDGRG